MVRRIQEKITENEKRGMLHSGEVISHLPVLLIQSFSTLLLVLTKHQSPLALRPANEHTLLAYLQYHVDLIFDRCLFLLVHARVVQQTFVDRRSCVTRFG